MARREDFIDADSDYVIVPIVSPASGDSSSGAVRNLHCGGGVNHKMLMRTRGGYSVHPDYAAKGYILLRDLFLAEKNEDGWKLYQRYLLVMQGKVPGERTRKSFPAAKLPAEVMKRRNAAKGDAFDDIFDDAPKPAREGKK